MIRVLVEAGKSINSVMERIEVETMAVATANWPLN